MQVVAVTRFVGGDSVELYMIEKYGWPLSSSLT